MFTLAGCPFRATWFWGNVTLPLSLQTFDIDEAPWFVAKDMSDALDTSGSVTPWLHGLNVDEMNTVQISHGIRGNLNKVCVPNLACTR